MSAADVARLVQQHRLQLAGRELLPDVDPAEEGERGALLPRADERHAARAGDCGAAAELPDAPQLGGGGSEHRGRTCGVEPCEELPGRDAFRLGHRGRHRLGRDGEPALRGGRCREVNHLARIEGNPQQRDDGGEQRQGKQPAAAPAEGDATVEQQAVAGVEYASAGERFEEVGRQLLHGLSVFEVG